MKHNSLIKTIWEEIKITKTKLFRSILIGVLFLCGYVITFIHILEAPLKEWKPYVENKKIYKEIVQEANQSTKSIIEEMKNDGFSLYAKKLENVSLIKNSKFKEYTKEKKRLANEYSFLGYPSKNIFWYDFGKSIFSLVPTVLLFILIFNPHLIKSLRKLLIIGALGFFYISFFWIIHNLFAKSDFGKLAYVSSFIIGALISTIITALLVYFFSYIEKKKKQTQEELKSIIDSGNELINTFKSTTT